MFWPWLGLKAKREREREKDRRIKKTQKRNFNERGSDEQPCGHGSSGET
jgi:hypothetical protein